VHADRSLLIALVVDIALCVALAIAMIVRVQSLS
jgi:hypothetical protein